MKHYNWGKKPPYSNPGVILEFTFSFLRALFCFQVAFIFVVSNIRWKHEVSLRKIPSRENIMPTSPTVCVAQNDKEVSKYTTDRMDHAIIIEFSCCKYQKQQRTYHGARITLVSRCILGNLLYCDRENILICKRSR